MVMTEAELIQKMRASNHLWNIDLDGTETNWMDEPDEPDEEGNYTWSSPHSGATCKRCGYRFCHFCIEYDWEDFKESCSQV